MSTTISGVIASVIVQARPDALDSVTACARRAVPGLDVHAHDPRGRLVVLLELVDDAALAEAMSTLNDLPGVLGTALVFHYSEAACVPSTATSTSEVGHGARQTVA